MDVLIGVSVALVAGFGLGGGGNPRFAMLTLGYIPSPLRGCFVPVCAGRSVAGLLCSLHYSRLLSCHRDKISAATKMQSLSQPQRGESG